jgi:hypothetical protein
MVISLSKISQTSVSFQRISIGLASTESKNVRLVQQAPRNMDKVWMEHEIKSPMENQNEAQNGHAFL